MNSFPKWYIIQSFCFQFHKNNNDINVKVNEHFKSKYIFKYTQKMIANIEGRMKCGKYNSSPTYFFNPDSN